MQHFSISPRELVASLWRNRELVRVLVVREVVGRYRGSVLGIFWSFFHPLFMLAVYTFVFSVVFQSRWNSGSADKGEFALVLFVGLMVFNLFAECLIRAPGLVLANPNYVKKVVFPLEVLPWVTLGAAAFHFCISLGVWLVAYLYIYGTPPATALLLPAVLVPLVLVTLGSSWILASLGVYLRDVSQVVGIITTVLMFLSPLFFPASAVPEEYRFVFNLNPLNSTIEGARQLLLWNEIPDPASLVLYMLASLGVAWAGFAWFQKTRKGFADVM